MGKLDGYMVDLTGMASETASYRWKADDDFFSAVQGPEIRHGLLDVALQVKRTSGAYRLEFRLKGEVEVPCDRCLEPMPCPIDALCTLKVVTGDGYADDGETVTIPEREGTLCAAWHIYEFAALQIPMRHVHPDGLCKNPSPALLKEDGESDPRWDGLKKLMKNDRQENA